MAYVGSYAYDVFVSYSLVNDEETMDDKPWVKRLVALLGMTLRGRLPGNKDVEIYFAGKGDLKPGDQLDSCREQAKRSAIFLIIGSPRYLDVWPTSELRAFSSNDGARDRILIAEQLPLDKSQSYLKDVGDPLRQEYWRRTEGGVPTPQQLSAECKDKIAELAEAIKDKLVALREYQAAPPGERQPNPAFRPVLLARVTDDLEKQRGRLRSYLKQFDIDVLPPEELDFEEEGAAFETEFARYLERRPIVAQLLSPSQARRWRELPEGFDNAQARLAAAAEGVRLRKWRDCGCDPATVDDELHRALLTDRVDEMDIEEFKDSLRREATAPPPPPPPSPDGRRHSYLFIEADQADTDVASEIASFCRAYKIPVMRPEYGVDSADDWRENYAAAERIALIHKRSNPRWLAAQMRLYMRTAIQSHAPQQCLILLAGPPPKQLDDFKNVYHPNFEFVEAPNGDISPLLARLVG